MPKYRKRPLVVDAEQWYPDRDVPGVFVEDPYDRNLETYEPDIPPGLPVRHFVVTIHRQRAYLKPGDWVISEGDGQHHYPCDADVFAARYEPADASNGG